MDDQRAALGYLLNTPLSSTVFGVGLLVLSIAGFVVYIRRKRWT